MKFKMKPNLNFAVMIIAFSVLISCSGKDYNQDWSKPKDEKIAFDCTLGSIRDYNMSWKASDRIGMFSNRTNPQNVALTVAASSAGQANGLFYTDLAIDKNNEYDFILYYPYSGECEGSVVKGRIPKNISQRGLDISRTASYNLYVGRSGLNDAGIKGSSKVTLKPIFDVVEIKLKSDLYAGCSLDKVVIKNVAGKELSGTWAFDLAGGSLSFLDSEDEIEINVTESELSNTGTSIFFPVNGQESYNELLNIEITLTKGERILVLSGEANVTLSTEISIDNFSVSGAEDESINLADPNGDGVTETANCYIAGRPGMAYRFPATVMGNGYVTPKDDSYQVGAGVLGSSPGITPVPLAPVSAKILWQTSPALLTNVTLKNDYVYFVVNGEIGGTLEAGNAVIAVYSGENCTGDILWSWHIWVTDADIESSLQTWKVHPDLSSYSAYQNPQLMDRNLGALSQRGFEQTGKNGDYGLYYQWGRKDPFVGSDDTKWASNTMRATYNSNGDLISVDANASVEFSSEVKWSFVKKVHLTRTNLGKYPMTFYYSGTTKNNQFWMDEICHDLWGCPGYADESNNIGHKTIYDPCPPGYRVMNAYVATGFTSKLGGGKYADVGNGSDIINYGNFITNKEALQIKTEGGSIAYIPATGMMYFEKVPYPAQRIGSYGYLWTAKMTSGYSSQAYRLHFDSNNFNSMGRGYVSYGHNVRCEKIK